MVKNILVPISPVNIVYNEQLTKSYKIAQKYTKKDAAFIS
jgi:hypothetical protein